jgi:hypothetical protein
VAKFYYIGGFKVADMNPDIALGDAGVHRNSVRHVLATCEDMMANLRSD